ncbi:hypothetical protein GWI33_017741 [Rhynchophorus ferrugineus]|uniref:Peptidase M13 C-terminal domain-containing protein n=1 Tax=Rhynchophorus ferrugineus TaxID=354439 RepID=A0A834HZ94_RHYFE|nr:hypothetical protein GWI33_017741 [Rhynchophorus ferrugineus]
MTCGGRTYVVNEDDGFCNGRKVRRYRDTSFRSIVGFMLLILLFWVVVSCVIYGIQKHKENQSNLPASSRKTPEEAHNDKYLSKEFRTTTPSPPIKVKKYDEDKNGIEFVPTVTSEEKNKSFVSTPVTTPAHDDKYGQSPSSSDTPHHHPYNNETTEREKSTETHPGNNYNTTERNFEKQQHINNSSTTVASVQQNETLSQTTPVYNKASSGYSPNFTTVSPQSDTAKYQENNNAAVTESIIKKEHKHDDKQVVKETEDSMVPVTETFIKKTAYTVGQEEEPVTDKTSPEITTLSPEPNTTQEYMRNNTKTSQNVASTETTTPQTTLLTTTSGNIKEQISSKSNSSQEQVDVGIISSKNPSAAETTTQINLLTTNVIIINEQVPAKSNSGQGPVDVSTISSQNSPTVEIATTEINLLTTSSNDFNEQISSNSNSSERQVDLSIITSEKSSAVEMTTAQINILTTNVNDIDEQVSAKSNSNQGSVDVSITTSQSSSAVEITTQTNLLTTSVNDINEEVSAKSNSSKGPVEVSITTSQNSSAVEMTTTEVNLLTTNANDIDEQVSSRSNSSQGPVDDSIITSQNSSFIEITTQVNLLTTNVNKINEETSSKSNSSQEVVDVNTISSQNSSAIEITTSQDNLVTTSANNINEQVSPKLNDSGKQFDMDKTPTENPAVEQGKFSTEQSSSSITNKNQIDESTGSSQTDSVVQPTTKETETIEEHSTIAKEIQEKPIVNTMSGSNTEYITTTMKTDVQSEYKTTTEALPTSVENLDTQITTTEAVLEKTAHIYSSNNIEVTTTVDKVITTTEDQQKIETTVKPTEVATMKNEEYSSRKVYATATTTEETLKSETEYNKEIQVTEEAALQKTTSTSEIPDLLKSTSTQLTPVFREPPILNETEKVKTCDTSNCKMKSSQILKLIDYETEPCENFYQFSCGDYHSDDKNTLVEVLLEAYYTGKIPKRGNPKYITSFFEKCLEYEETTSITDKIEKVRNINVRKDDLTHILRHLMVHQSTPFFDIRLGPLNKNNPYTIQVVPPSSGYHKVGLKNWSIKKHIEQHCYQSCMSYHYKKQIDLNEVHNKYKKCQRDTFKKISEHFFTTYNTSVSDEDDFLSFFQNIMFDTSNLDIEQELLSKNYRKITVDELSKKYDVICDWIGLFKNISYGQLKENSTVYVLMEDQYFKPLMDMLKKRTKTASYLMDHLMTYFQLELGEFLLKPIDNRNRFCMQQTVELMPELANYVFVQYSKLQKSNMRIFEELFKDVLSQYYWIIDQSELEEDNKLLIKNKLDTLKLRDFIDVKKDSDSLETIMESINLSEDHLSAVLMLMEGRRQTSYSLPTPIDIYFLNYLLNDPFDSLPRYIPYTGKIVIPNAYVYDIRKMEKNKIPKYVYTTKIKFHLSRAVALYLDEVLVYTRSSFYRQFGKNLDYGLQGDETVLQIHDQQIKYKADNDAIWEKVLNVSLRNRVADNLALRVAFTNTFNDISQNLNALPWLSESHTPEKQYFILVAQEYCKKTDVGEMSQSLYETSELTPALRIETLMIHSNDFNEQFKCTPGTAMNPEIDKTQFDLFKSEEYEYQS